MAERVLVTGGMGFIGSFVVDRLVERGLDVRVLDNLDPQIHSRGLPDYANPDAEFVHGDIRDEAAVETALDGTDLVVHLAAAVGVAQGQYEVTKYADVNVGGTARLMAPIVAGRTRVRKVVVAASMSSYGEGRYSCAGCGPVDPPLRSPEDVAGGRWEPRCPGCGGELKGKATPEDKRQQPNSIYAITKRTQEEMVLNLGRGYGVPAVALRFFNAYGPRQSLSNPYNGVAAIFLSRLKNGKPPVVFEDGGQTRDFVWIDDVTASIELALFGEGANYGSYNVGSGAPIGIAEVARVLARELGVEIEPRITGAFRKGDVRHCFADTTAMRRALGFEPRVAFEEGIRRLVAWSRGQEATDLFDKAEQEWRSRGLL